MNMLTFVFVSALTFVYLAGVAPQTLYSPKYEQIDYEKILSNKRILESYVKCVTEKGPCTPEATDIKKILPEVLATSCAKCSPGLKTIVQKTITTMQDKYPDQWQLVVNKYDPKREHAKKLEAFLKA
uniref:Chemosensory protein 1 n=1 Tax=Subpsaltria yangi TaxID=1195109 RepID=A0A385IUQ0_9HEMI|nr:chemosensory protein 1 [Subpsaltria yangi]